MDIRTASFEDLDGILNVYAATFEDAEKSILLAKLQTSDLINIALVGIEYGEIVGHIAFSEVEIEDSNDKEPIQGSVLVSIVVAPTHQNNGLGSELIRQGIELCKENCDEATFVCSDKHFFKAFGFYRIHTDFIKTSNSELNFMVLEHKSGVFDHFSGFIKFPEAFNF